MPREVWAVQLEVSTRKALEQLGTIEKRLSALETKFRTLGATSSPAAAKNLNNISTATKKAGDSATVAQSKFKRFTTSIGSGFSDFSKILARRLAFIAATMIETFTFVFILAIPAAFVAAIKAGAAFEDAMLRTATVASGGLEGMEENYVKLSEAALTMAAEVAFSATEVADAMFEMVSSGLDVEETIGAMPAVINFAGSAMTSLGTSVDITTQIMKSFGLGAEDMDDVADVLVTALNTTTLTVERLQSGMRFAAPAGAAFEQSLEDVTAVLALFVDVTKQGGIAGRAFRFAISSLARPVGGAADVLANLRDKTTGAKIAADEFSLFHADGKPRSIITIFRTLGRSTVTTANLLEVFGKRAAPVVSVAMLRLRRSMEEAKNGTSEFADVFDEMDQNFTRGKGADVARMQYEGFLKSTTNLFNIFKAVVENAMNHIFVAIKPLVDQLALMAAAVLRNTDVMDGFLRISRFLGVAVLSLATYFGGRLAKGLIATSTAVRALRIMFVGLRAGTLTLARAGQILGKAFFIGWVMLAIEIIADIIDQFNIFEKVINAVRRAFGFADRQVEESGKSFSIIGAISDTLVIAFGFLGLAVLYVWKALQDSLPSMDSWRVWLTRVTAFAGLAGNSLHLLAGAVSSVASQWDEIEITDDSDAIDKQIASLKEMIAHRIQNLGLRGDGIDMNDDEVDALNASTNAMREKIGLSAIDIEQTRDLTIEELRHLKTVGSLSVEAMEKYGEEIEKTVEQKILDELATEGLNESRREELLALLDYVRYSERKLKTDKLDEEMTERLEKAYNKVFSERLSAIDQLQEYKDSLIAAKDKGLKPSIIELAAMKDWMDNLDPTVRDNIDSTGDFERGMNELHGQMVEAAGGQDALALALKLYLDLQKDAVDHQEEYNDTLYAMGERSKKIVDGTLLDMASAFDSVFSSQTGAIDSTNEMITALQEMRRRGSEPTIGQLIMFVKHLDEAQEAIDTDMIDGTTGLSEALETLWKELGLSAEQLEVLRQAANDAAKETTAVDKIFDDIATGIGEALGAALFEAESFGEALKKTFKAIGTTIFTELLKPVTQGISDALAPVKQGIGDVIGKFTGFLGALGPKGKLIAGAIAGALALGAAFLTIFKGDKLKKDIENTFAHLGKLSDELIDKIKETAKEVGHVAAAATHLGEVMDEVGVTVKNFGGFVKVARDTLAAMDYGAINTGKAIEILEGNVADLIEQSKKLGIVGSKDLINMLKDIRSRGLEVAGVFEYFDENLRLAATGIEKIMLASVTGARKEFVSTADILIEKFTALGEEADKSSEGWKSLQREGLAMIELFLRSGSQSDELKSAMEELAEVMGIEMPESAAKAKAMLDALGGGESGVDGIAGLVERFDALEDASENQSGAWKNLEGDLLHMIELFYRTGGGSEEAKTKLQELANSLGIEFPSSADAAKAALELLGIEFVEVAGDEDTLAKGLETLAIRFGELEDAEGSQGEALKVLQGELLHMIDLFFRSGGSVEGAKAKFGELADAMGIAFPESAAAVKLALDELEIEYKALANAETEVVDAATALEEKFKNLELGGTEGDSALNVFKGELLNLIAAFYDTGIQSEDTKKKLSGFAKSLGIDFPISAEAAKKLLDELGIEFTEIPLDEVATGIDTLIAKFKGFDVAGGDTEEALKALKGEALHMIEYFYRSGNQSDVARAALEKLADTMGIAFPTSAEEAKKALDELGIEFVAITNKEIATSDEIERLGRLALATFNGMIDNGASVTEAMDSIRPSLDILKEKMALAGITGSEALDELIRWADLTETHRDVIAGFEGITETMEGLSNAGILNQDIFNDLTNQAFELMGKLEDAGVEGRDAFLLMAPSLAKIIKQAKDQGFEIDEATQALIDQANEYGVLEGVSGEKGTLMERTLGRIATVLEELVRLMGGDGVAGAIANSEQDWKNYGDKVGGVINNVKDGVGAAFNSMKDASKETVEGMLSNFYRFQDETVGHTIFGDVAEKGSAFLDQLGDKGVEVAGRLDFAGPLSDMARSIGADNGPNIITTSAATPGLADQSRGMTKFEKENLTLMKDIVDAVIASGDGGGSQAGAAPNLVGLRQTISEVMRDASIDGEAEVHVDSIARLR